MKKFSWIFALLLALSIGFIGCPESAPAPKGGGGGGGGGEPEYPYNTNATDIPIAFGAGANQYAVTNRTPNGQITYPTTPAGSYKFVYGTTNDDKNSNAVNRFKLTLGQDGDGKDFTLADYGKITFKWKATGFNGNPSVTSNKNLFLLASEDEDG